MSKEIYISSTPHETRLAIVENDELAEIYYERENEYTLAGSIYNGKVTRVLPGMQSSFVDIGLERDAFLYITDFMEEAGDTADFEGAHGGGEGRRPARDAGRPEGEGRHNGRDNHGDRGTQPKAAAPELSDAEMFRQAVSGAEPVQANTGADRGGNRRGGRGRRDRQFNSDGTPRRDRDRSTNGGADRGIERGADRSASPPRLEAPVAPILEAPQQESTEDGAVGEGSRRWRGRRGRRGSRAETPQENGTAMSPVTDTAEAGGFGEPETTMESFVESSAVMETPGGYAPRVDQEGGGREGREPRSGRGERGRGGRGSQVPRAPRGFAPTTSLYQVDGSAEASAQPEEQVEAAPEPLILPGESLSKYRSGGETQGKVSAAPVADAAVPEFVVQGWDGGLVLPGETIRPRTPRTDGDGAAAGSRGSSDRGGRGERDRGNRDERRDGGRSGREDRGRRQESNRGASASSGGYADVPMQLPVTNVPEPGTAAATHSGSEAGSGYEGENLDLQAAADDSVHVSTGHEVISQHAADEGSGDEQQVKPAAIDSTFVAPPPMPTESVQTQPVETTSAAQEEYEPTEASASYRIDPVAPSEFRQSFSSVDEQPAPEASEQLPEHEVTSISSTGFMHSESPELEAQELTAVAPSAQGMASSQQPMSSELAAADQTLPYFAPGAGFLEEEMMDDEDGEPHAPVESLHAHGEDRHEQETLEGAADLGTMLREMSIDQITRSEGSVDTEDEELDEDFLEEDQDFDSEDGGEESESSSENPEENVGESAEQLEDSAYGSSEPAVAEGETRTTSQEPSREPRRDERRRDGRRGERSRRPGDRERGVSDRSGSERSGSERSSSDRGRREGGRGRASMQSTNLPAISELLKPGQEILVQIAKEPMAKKGARITSHIALPGRFLVFMPTVQHTGVSRKIESDTERRRLKDILLSEKGESAGGFIVRTAAAGASEEELRSDLRFLLNLWSDIKARSEGSKSPALIYHDLNLVERVLRDQVTDTFSAIWVDTESEYERVLRFLQRFQPSLIRRVKLYSKETPMFEQFGITEEINKALRSKVWLKSGGSIVINQTEALVAIDINTGKFVGKTARLEDTIVKTNLDAIPEIVRQIRLRDLGGIIIIDFIDMDERKNRNRVMAALEEELKSDRAPSKVLQFNDFGLVAITRKRVKQSLERTLSTTCGVCQGTGMTKSPVSVCNDIYIELRKMHKHLDRGDIMLRVHPEVVKQLKATPSRWLQEMEEMAGKTILVKSDPSLHPEQFDIH